MGDGVTYPTRNVDLDSDCLLAERQRWMEEGEADQPNGNTGTVKTFVAYFLPDQLTVHFHPSLDAHMALSTVCTS